jgi:hypothetical protein
MKSSLLNRPFGTQSCPTAIPALKTLGYFSFHASGMALGEDACATMCPAPPVLNRNQAKQPS